MVEAVAGPDALQVGDRSIPYIDLDGIRVDGHDVAIDLAGGQTLVLAQMGRTRDDFLRELRGARAPVRRAALLQWAGTAPIDSYEAWQGDTPVTVFLFAGGLTVEADSGVPAFVPFPLLDEVTRDGYRFTFSLKGGMAPVAIEKAGKRTDELAADLAAARRDLTAATAAGYAAIDPSLVGFDAADGWAVGRSAAGEWWTALRAAVAGQSRAAEIDLLERLAGDALRLGLRVVGAEPLSFALAPVSGKVAVEGTDTDARATFVFATDDVDRLNAALLLTNFRREAISLPEAELGRWALAVRALEVVRWARQTLVARIVHDDTWEAKVSVALAS